MFWDINDDFIYHVAIKVNFSCTYTFFCTFAAQSRLEKCEDYVKSRLEKCEDYVKSRLEKCEDCPKSHLEKCVDIM